MRRTHPAYQDHTCKCGEVIELTIFPGSPGNRHGQREEWEEPQPPSIDPTECPGCGRGIEKEDLDLDEMFGD